MVDMQKPIRDEPELYVEIIYLMRERGVRNAPNIRAWHDPPGARCVASILAIAYAHLRQNDAGVKHDELHEQAVQRGRD